MRPRSLLYSLREALRSVRMNGLMSVASASAVGISLLVLALFLMLALNMDHMATELENQVEMKVYIDNAVTDPAMITNLQHRIAEAPGVSEVRFVSREEAFEQLKERWGKNADLLEGTDISSIANSFDVRVPDVSLLPIAAQAIETEPGIEKVDYKADVVDKLFTFTRTLRIVGLILVAILSVATVFMISNTIRLTVFARRREIAIMKMVGATDRFIRRPFLVEGMVLGIIGSLLAGGLVYWTYLRVFDWVFDNLPWLPFLGPDPLLQNLVLVLVLLGALLGYVGSGIAVRRFLRV